ncbi:MAG: glycosyl hydrolase, partial [Acidobacteriota bacterium]|nr:glycosyl hydrolase [Acidobacteriota bacterium]
PPGRYQARLVVDGKEQKCWFNVKKDPRLTDVTDADLKAQFDLALKIRDKESAANEAVILIRNLKIQVEDRLSKTDDRKLRKTAKEFVERISSVEKELYQVKNQSPKDKIAFPIKLNDRLTGLRSHLERGDAAPTKGYYQVFEELSAELTIQLQALERILVEDLLRLNEELERLGFDRIVMMFPIKEFLFLAEKVTT